MAYVCHICNKKYQREKCFRSHVSICEFKSRTKKERDEEINSYDDIPSKKDLFIQIVFLTKELEKVKSELEIVKRTQGVRKNKVSIISWLNDNYKPEITLRDIVRNIVVTKEDFYKLQHHKTKTVYVEIIKKYLVENIDKRLPLCSFPQSVDCVYVYTDNIDSTLMHKPSEHGSESRMMWTNISEIFIQSIISSIEEKMLKRFNEWETEMEEKIYENEEISEQYSVYVSAIIGKSNKNIVSEITRYMKPKLYQLLKSKNIDMSVTEITA